MDNIKNTIRNVVEDMFTKNAHAQDARDVEGFLKKLLTKKEREHIKFKYFKNGVISANVDSSSWLYSLSLRKDVFMQEFNKKGNKVKDLRFYLGDIK